MIEALPNTGLVLVPVLSWIVIGPPEPPVIRSKSRSPSMSANVGLLSPPPLIDNIPKGFFVSAAKAGVLVAEVFL